MLLPHLDDAIWKASTSSEATGGLGRFATDAFDSSPRLRDYCIHFASPSTCIETSEHLIPGEVACCSFAHEQILHDESFRLWRDANTPGCTASSGESTFFSGNASVVSGWCRWYPFMPQFSVMVRSRWQFSPFWPSRCNPLCCENLNLQYLQARRPCAFA